MASPVAQFARKNNIQLLQPEKVRKNEEFFAQVRELNPDICLVVAYGKILPQELLDIPAMGFLNVHTSLLPKYRGAAPIQHALLYGEKITGLTIQQMSLGMDEGDILVQESWDIAPTDTTGTLFAKTGERGGPLLMQAVIGLRDKTITPIPQDHTQASYTKMIEKSDGQLNPIWTVDQAYHAWQGFTPWPGLYTMFNGIKVTLLEVEKMKNAE
jgi:methionyl-tRNA formyltransferase